MQLGWWLPRLEATGLSRAITAGLVQGAVDVTMLGPQQHVDRVYMHPNFVSCCDAMQDA